MSFVRAAATALAFCMLGCAAAQPQHARPAPATPAVRDDLRLSESARRLQLLLSQLQVMSGDAETLDALRVVGMDAGPVPEFELVAGARRYSSKELVGKRPFVAVFFATWCDYCQGELRAMQQAFRQTGGPIAVIPVSVDGPETWHKVPAYLASFGIHEPAVRASDYPLFAISYNPVDVLPSLVVVGRNGSLVDYLHGYHPAHADRLLSSLRAAKTTGPLTLPQLSAAYATP